MILKNKTFWLVLIIPTVLVAYILISPGNMPKIDPDIVKESASIAYSSQYNYRQTQNDCGPFNVAAVVRALKDQGVDSALFAKEIGWRLPNKYTLPWGLEKQLKMQGISIEKPQFNLLADDEKIAFLQQSISLGKPIIILGEREDYEHYITLLGFNAATDQYYIYDSLQSASPDQPSMTTDDNGPLPGNATLNSSELLDFWRGGGMYGLWEWYGLVASL